MEIQQTEMTDEQAVALVQGGDKEKFGILMARYEKKLFRYGKRFLSGKEHIEDIIQDVFMSTYKNIRSFDPSLKFSSWIYRIAHNAFVNALKKGSRNPLLVFDFDFDTLISHPVHEDPAIVEREQKELKKMMDQCLDQLSPKYKEVIILHYYEELSYKEMGDILEIPIGTVGIRIKRAKDALRKIYEPLQKRHE